MLRALPAHPKQLVLAGARNEMVLLVPGAHKDEALLGETLPHPGKVALVEGVLSLDFKLLRHGCLR